MIFVQTPSRHPEKITIISIVILFLSPSTSQAVHVSLNVLQYFSNIVWFEVNCTCCLLTLSNGKFIVNC